jgi:hypothetical protein
MNYYTVTYNDGSVIGSRPFLMPDRLPHYGDVYVWTVPGRTLGGEYSVGDRMEVLERTTDAPFHRTSSLGNLKIRCKHGVSIWTEFESAIVSGSLKLLV